MTKFDYTEDPRRLAYDARSLGIIDGATFINYSQTLTIVMFEHLLDIIDQVCARFSITQEPSWDSHQIIIENCTPECAIALADAIYDVDILARFAYGINVEFYPQTFSDAPIEEPAREGYSATLLSVPTINRKGKVGA